MTLVVSGLPLELRVRKEVIILAYFLLNDDVYASFFFWHVLMQYFVPFLSIYVASCRHLLIVK